MYSLSRDPRIGIDRVGLGVVEVTQPHSVGGHAHAAEVVPLHRRAGADENELGDNHGFQKEHDKHHGTEYASHAVVSAVCLLNLSAVGQAFEPDTSILSGWKA